MAITDFLRSAGRGAKSIGKAVMGAVQPQAQAAPVDNTPGLNDEPRMPDFSLPEIGSAPDLNDPKYNSDTSPAGQYENDLADYQHKKQIHDAFAELDRIYTEAHPQRDFKGEYAQEMAALSKDQNYHPEGSFLKRFALSLGDFNPAVETPNAPQFDKQEAEKTKRHDYFEGKKLDLQRKMHEQMASEAEQKGNWKKALAEQQTLQMFEYDKERRAAADKMAIETKKQEAATERANIRKEGVTRAAQIAASARLGGVTKGSAYDKMVDAMIKNWAKNYAPQGLTNIPSTLTLHDLVEQMDDLKEEMNPNATPSTPHQAPAKKKEKF